MGVVKEFKQSELGYIPNDWNLLKLSEVSLDMIQGVNTAIDIPEYSSDGIPMLKANNIIDKTVGFADCDYVTEKTFEGYSQRYKPRINDFLFSNIGARLGTGSILKDNVKCCFAWNVLRIIPDSKRVVPHFLAHILNSPKISDSIKSQQAGSGMGFVPKGTMQNVLLPIPTKAEQEAIANALSDADAYIESLEQLIAKKSLIKKGVMQELLTGKRRLPGFSGKWTEFTIFEVADILDNLRVPLNDSERTKIPGPYPYCGANGVLDYIANFCIEDSIILIAEDGGHFEEYSTRPIAYRMSGKIWVNNHAHVLKTKEYFDQDFLYYSLVHKNILNFLASGTRAKLNKSELLKIPVYAPVDNLERCEIAKILNQIDFDVEAQQGKLIKARQIKQGMMQELLTGRIRLV